jgi:hypothetical protein
MLEKIITVILRLADMEPLSVLKVRFLIEAMPIMMNSRGGS